MPPAVPRGSATTNGENYSLDDCSILGCKQLTIVIVMLNFCDICIISGRRINTRFRVIVVQYLENEPQVIKQD